jgi:hypothetical protein
MKKSDHEYSLARSRWLIQVPTWKKIRKKRTAITREVDLLDPIVDSLDRCIRPRLESGRTQQMLECSIGIALYHNRAGIYDILLQSRLNQVHRLILFSSKKAFLSLLLFSVSRDSFLYFICCGCSSFIERIVPDDDGKSELTIIGDDELFL